jgi:hypothetical protein
MTTLANVTLPENIILDPVLAHFVVPFALANPTYSFTNTKSTHMWSDVSIDKIGDNYINPPDGKKFTRELLVYSDNQKVGEVKIEKDWRKSVIMYSIKSDRIQKTRGMRDVTSSSKLNIAMRHAKKYWKAKDLAELYSISNAKVRSELRDSISNLKHRISRGAELGSKWVKIQVYMFHMLTNREINPLTKREIEDIFTSPSYAKHMGDYRLARDIERLLDANKITSVMKHEGGYMFYENDNVVCKVYEDLPEDWQNKLAVLQLVSDEEIVRDVGFKYTNESFAIIK